MAVLNVPNFEGQPTGWQSLWLKAYSIVPSDGADLAAVSRGLRVGVAGDVKITTAAGDVVTVKNVQIGEILPYFVKRVWATGTTATDILGGE